MKKVGKLNSHIMGCSTVSYKDMFALYWIVYMSKWKILRPGTYKFGNFTNFKALFSVMSTDFS